MRDRLKARRSYVKSASENKPVVKRLQNILEPIIRQGNQLAELDQDFSGLAGLHRAYVVAVPLAIMLGAIRTV